MTPRAVLLSSLFNLLFASANSNAAPAVKVAVTAEHLGSKIMYSYRVTNNSTQAISAIAIGRSDNESNELSVRPSGWNAASGIPQSSSTTPSGWKISLVSAETHPPYAINWEAGNTAARLAADQTLEKLSITVDQADAAYLQGHALISFANNDPASLVVPIERLDTTPPKLVVTLTPNTLAAATNKYVPIHASFSVKGDNIDHLPQVRLESITANEPLQAEDIRDASYGLDDRYFKLRAEHLSQSERVYKVNYSATDASGNRSIASATVTVQSSR